MQKTGSQGVGNNHRSEEGSGGRKNNKKLLPCRESGLSFPRSNRGYHAGVEKNKIVIRKGGGPDV